MAVNAGAAHRSGGGDYRVDPSAILIWRGRKKLAPAADCCVEHPADRGDAWNVYASCRDCALEPANERLERRSGTRTLSERHNRAGAARRTGVSGEAVPQLPFAWRVAWATRDRKSTRLTSSHP